MLHLFKKVYVATDNIIDVGVDRVVVSFEHGHDTLEDLKKVMGGELIAFGQDWSKLIGSKNTAFLNTADIFDKLGDHSDKTGKRVIIYCDDKAFKTIMALWFHTIFNNITKKAAVDLLESMVFKYDIFGQARFASNNGNTDVQHTINIEGFDKVFSSANKPSAAVRKKFLAENKSALSFEYLLATYLANGKMKKELKTVMQILVKKDLEKYLGELKETFFSHILTKKLMSKLNLNKTYDFTNYNEILNDDSEYPTVFMNPLIWKMPFLAKPTSGKNVQFNNITNKDIQSFGKFANIIGTTWEEGKQLEFVNADISKLDFIEYIQGEGMTDEQLDTIIEVESSYDHEAGSFFSIDLETVNNYFVQAILDAHKAKDVEFLKQYSIA